MSEYTFQAPCAQDFSDLKELIEKFSYHHGKVISSIEEVNFHVERSSYFLKCIKECHKKHIGGDS